MITFTRNMPRCNFHIIATELSDLPSLMVSFLLRVFGTVVLDERLASVFSRFDGGERRDF